MDFCNLPHLRAVASAIWQYGFQEDPYSSAAGRRYWAECLAHGGGKPSHRIVSDYLEQPGLVPASLAGALVSELDTKNQEVEEALRVRR
jgi:hypothetical protein